MSKLFRRIIILATMLIVIYISVPNNHLIAEAESDDSESCKEYTTGKELEDLSKFKKAEEAYIKALKCEDSEILENARKGIKRISSTKFENWFNDFFSKILSDLSLILRIFLLSILIFCFPKVLRFLIDTIKSDRKQNSKAKYTLDVHPIQLYTNPSGMTKYDFKYFLHKVMEDLCNQKIIQQQITKFEIEAILPTIRSVETSSELGQIATVLSPKTGPIVDRIVKFITPPDYELDGLIHVLDSSFHILLTLKKGNNNIKIWDDSFSTNDAINRLQDIAFEVLMYLQRERQV